MFVEISETVVPKKIEHLWTNNRKIIAKNKNK